MYNTILVLFILFYNFFCIILNAMFISFGLKHVPCFVILV